MIASCLTGCDGQPASRLGQEGLPLLANLAGDVVNPFTNADSRATVVIFVGVECPISNRYAPELRRLHGKFSPQKIDWWMVYPGTNYSTESIRVHAREFNLPGQAAIDSSFALSKLAQARITPEAAVFLPGARLIYHGRIDDRFPTLGVERPSPTRRDLEETIDAILAGKTIAYAEAKAVGCFIQYPP